MRSGASAIAHDRRRRRRRVTRVDARGSASLISASISGVAVEMPTAMGTPICDERQPAAQLRAGASPAASQRGQALGNALGVVEAIDADADDLGLQVEERAEALLFVWESVTPPAAMSWMRS